MVNEIETHKLKKVLAWPCACCADDNDLWIMHGKINVLFYHSLLSGKTEAVMRLKKEVFFQEASMASMIEDNKRLYLIPRWGKYIHCVDCCTKEERLIDLPHNDEYDNYMRFSVAYKYNKMIYCVPENYRYFLEINPVNNDVRVLFDVKEIIRKIGIETVSLGKGALVKNGKVYVNVLMTNKILCFDLNTKSCDILEMDNVYDCVAANDDYIFMSNNEKSIITIWDNEQRKIVDTLNSPLDNFAISCLNANSLLVDSITDGRFAVIDLNGNLFSNEEHRSYYGTYGYTYHHGIVCDHTEIDKLYFSRHSYSLYKIDKHNSVEKCTDQLVGLIDDRFLPYDNKTLIRETELFDLNWMIQGVINHEWY